MTSKLSKHSLVLVTNCLLYLYLRNLFGLQILILLTNCLASILFSCANIHVVPVHDSCAVLLLPFLSSLARRLIERVCMARLVPLEC